MKIFMHLLQEEHLKPVFTLSNDILKVRLITAARLPWVLSGFLAPRAWSSTAAITLLTLAITERIGYSKGRLLDFKRADVNYDQNGDILKIQRTIRGEDFKPKALMTRQQWSTSKIETPIKKQIRIINKLLWVVVLHSTTQQTQPEEELLVYFQGVFLKVTFFSK